MMTIRCQANGAPSKASQSHFMPLSIGQRLNPPHGAPKLRLTKSGKGSRKAGQRGVTWLVHRLRFDVPTGPVNFIAICRSLGF